MNDLLLCGVELLALRSRHVYQMVEVLNKGELVTGREMLGLFD
jgi:hypothetical protein